MKRVLLALLALLVGIATLEVALRTTGWLFLELRRPRVYPSEKRGQQYRILCLGESTTADPGAWAGADSYPAQLERTLKERAAGLDFIVVNGGIPAATTDTIVEKLPKQLDELSPDIVVVMMGINDRESTNATFQISGRLRVWKLAKMLWYTWRESQAIDVDDPQRGYPPWYMRVAAQVAWEHVLAGRYAEAHDALRRDLGQEQSISARARANGIMAVASWQQHDDGEAESYHRRYVELQHRIPQSLTVDNYRKLRRILAEHRVPLVVVQYPAMPVELVKEIADDDPAVVFVDNERTFIEATKAMPARELYRDLFAGIFGHLTPYGNRLLATNVADAILHMIQQ